MTDILVSKETGNQYKVLNKIGEGAYAEVFKGENIKTKEKVAIKKMKNMKKAVYLFLYRTLIWPRKRSN